MSPDEATKTCSFCKQIGHAYADCAKAKRHRARKKGIMIARKNVKPVRPSNGFAGALAALRAERTDLDAAIAALERLEARAG